MTGCAACRTFVHIEELVLHTVHSLPTSLRRGISELEKFPPRAADAAKTAALSLGPSSVGLYDCCADCGGQSSPQTPIPSRPK